MEIQVTNLSTDYHCRNHCCGSVGGVRCVIKKQLADYQQVAFYMRCRTRIRTSTNWTKTSCAAITPYDSPPKRVCKYTFFYFCTNTQAKKYARLIKKLEFEGSKLLNHLHHTNAKFKKIRKSVFLYMFLYKKWAYWSK